MKVLIGVILGLYVGEVYSGTCSEAYTCPLTCYKTVVYRSKCGLFGWSRCTKHRVGSFTCNGTCHRNVCCDGYNGTECDTPVCFGSTSCQNGGTCLTPDNCTCPVGFESPSCNDTNECFETTHGCEHNCVNTDGSYHCTCRSGYILHSNLKTCLDLNECNKNNGNCEESCNNTVGSYTCACKDGYKLNQDGRTCSDIDECSLGSHECTEFCQNTPGSYTCFCSRGYKLDSDGYYCQDIDECSVNNGNCNQLCINQAGSYRCECRSGYRTLDGATTNICKDIDECAERTSFCTQTCTNTNGSYICSCNRGYVLSKDEKTCTDANECEKDNGGCQHVCTNTDGSFTCSCNGGYILNSDSKTCTDIDECEANNGGCQHICTNEEGTFKCSCRLGFNLQRDIKSCIYINECEQNNGGCNHTCINDDGSLTCNCHAGYKLLSDSISCQDIDECKIDNGNCEHECLNFVGVYACTCPVGKMLRSDNKTCTELEKNYVFPSVRISFYKTAPLSDSKVYMASPITLKHYFETFVSGIKSVFINTLRFDEKSFVANYTVVYNEDKNVNTRIDAIVYTIMKLEAGVTLLVDEIPAHVQAILPASSDDPCQLREMLAGPCQEGWQCVIDDSKPSCRLKLDESENVPLIVADVLGSVLFLVAFVVLILFCKFKRKVQNGENSPSLQMSEYEAGQDNEGFVRSDPEDSTSC